MIIIEITPYERKVWWLIRQLRDASYPFDQADMANRALFRATTFLN